MPPNGASEAKEEDIEYLLETIPDVDTEAKPPRAAKQLSVVNVHELMASVRRDVERVFHAELERVEKTFSAYVSDLESRLKFADGELSRLAVEKERLEDENQVHEQRWNAIRNIAGVNDRP